MNPDKLVMYLSRDTRARVLIELEALGDEYKLSYGFEVQLAKRLLMDSLIAEIGDKQTESFLGATKSEMGL